MITIIISTILVIAIILNFRNYLINLFKGLNYQFEHWYYVNKIYYKNYSRISLRVLVHDLDKIWPLIVNRGGKLTKLRHKRNSRHHLSWMQNHQDKVTKEDVKEMVCDWESARFSKEDKQETAYEYFSSHSDKLVGLNSKLIYMIQFHCLKIKS